jgi:Brp/Blh family beta-carotene 15,15'-monooxygenase
MVKEVATEKGNLLHQSVGGRRHQLAVLLITVLALVGSVFMPSLSIEQQFWIALVPIGLFGLSHGGADPTILQKLTGSSSGRTFIVLAAYVSASLSFIALIWFYPVLALLMFLGLSVWHFGYTDEAFLSATDDFRLRWLSGSAPVLGPMIGHPAQTSELFAWLIKAESTRVLDVMVWLAPSLAVIWLLVFGSLLFGGARRPESRAVVELILVAALLVALPPLLGFAFYFCAIHSLRHFLAILEHRLMARRKPGWMKWPGRKFLPATAGALVLALVAWGAIVLLEPSTSLLVEAVRVMFWALAALTLPHAVIVRLWWRRSNAG